MQFSESTNDTGLYQDALFLVGKDTNNFPIKDFTRLVNRHYYDAVVDIWKSQDSWIFDDTNNSGLPQASQNLVDSQEAYDLPTGALKVRRVEVLDNSGDAHVLQPIREEEIGEALSEFAETDGLPRYYRLIKDQILLYPEPAAASVTTTNGLTIYFLREVDEFAATDTTQEPGIPEPFHRILSLGAAYDFAIAKSLPQSQSLLLEKERLMVRMREFFATRHEASPPKLRPRVTRPR